jgi:AraC family L-rhamnose operon transcriptional activator RhaR
VHRHLPEHASVEQHRHRWCQVILYLSGRGQQTFAGAAARVEPGTLVVMPPGIAHAFHRTTERPPLCLMIDFRLAGARRNPAAVCSLNRSEITQVRQNLAYLIRLQAESGGVLRWEAAAAVLQTLITLLRAARWAKRVPQPQAGGSSVMGRLLATLGPATPLRQVVQRSGYQRDHLNRLVKRETGLTLGQLRTQRRLARAKELLSQGMRVANVAELVGVLDQSYFARWFRRQTGQPPSRWSPHIPG